MRRLLLCFGLLAIAGCGASELTKPGDIAGVYTLRTVDGVPLPHTYTDGAQSMTVLSDVITLESNKSWSELTRYQQARNGQIISDTLIDGGSYSLAGNVLTLEVPGEPDADYGGTYSKDTLTIHGLGAIQVFVR